MLLYLFIVTLGAVLATKQDQCRGVLPIPTEKCNEYVLNHNGKPYTYECPDGLLFNKKKLRCDLPENTDCLEPNECIKNGIECPKEDSDKPVFIPLPNCTQFCECSNGVPYVRRCPFELHWNPILDTCDFPANAGCPSRTTTSAPTTTSLAPESTTPKSEEDIGTEICLQEGVVCLGNEPAYQATSNCSNFCQCANGRPYLKVCKYGLHFNPELNVCDWPENVGCRTRTTTSAPTTTTLATETTTPESDEDVRTTTSLATESTTPESDEDVETTTSVTTESTTPKSDEDIRVITSLATESTTPKSDEDVENSTSLATESTTSKSDDVETTTSLATESTTPKSEDDTKITTSLAIESTTPKSDEDVENSTSLATGSTTSKSDDVETTTSLATESTTPKSEDDTKTTTSLATESTTPKSEEDIGTEICLQEGVVCHGNKPAYQATSNCSEFCQCANGRPYLKVCKHGLHFNPELNVCDWPENAGCKNRTTTTTTTSKPVTRSPKEGTRICRGQGVSCPRVDPPTPIYRAVSNCSQFCECSNGTPFLFDCPAGTLFNEGLNVCDWPYNVQCSV